MIPLRTDSPLRQTPWVNWGLIAANVIVFVLERSLAWRWNVAGRLHLDPANPHVWSFFTYAFAHADVVHLLGNMLFLYIFGNNVNDKLGHAGYLGFYLAGSVFAGAGYMLTEMASRGTMHPVIGASGAVSAVTGAYLVLFPRSHVTILYFFFFIGTIELPSIWFIGLYFVQDLILNTGRDGVAHMAHLSGTVFGFGVCLVLLAMNLLPRDVFDIVSVFQRWNRRRQYRDLVAKGYDPFAPGVAEAKESAPPTAEQERIGALRGRIGESLSGHDPARAAELYRQLKAVDAGQILSRQAQLDVANQLTAEQRYAEAAEAYEGFLRQYRNYEQVEQVELMLGLIHARYLGNHARAKELLEKALGRLRSEREIAMAKDELGRIGGSGFGVQGSGGAGQAI